MSTYNGWANRETWLVNIWFMDSFDCEETVSAESLQEWVEEDVYGQIKECSFIADMIDLGCIDWTSLAEHHNYDVEK